MNNLSAGVDGGDAAVWARLDDAKKLYEAYLEVNSTASLSTLCTSVTNHVEVREEFPPLTLALYR